MKRNVNTLPDYYTIVSSDKTKRYVELALFADHSMVYEKYNKDEETIHKRLEDIALFVNRFYDPLGITITLVYTEVWKNGDPFQVSTDPDQTLSSFLDYRKGQIKGHPHDNAHLITNIKFAGIVGKAYKGTMCSFDYSGGVDVDHSTDIRAVAATLAHEMGHNFGMEHDVDYDTISATMENVEVEQTNVAIYGANLLQAYTMNVINKIDAICGRLHCQNSKERPEFGDPSTVYSGYSKVLGVSGDEIACRVVRTTFTGDEPDPGLVPDGAKCGADKMCVESKCVNRSAIMERVQKCKPSNCNGLGICNNVGNCHCEYGYGGEACAIPGYGGSINSGPASDKEAFNAFMAMFWLVLVVSLAFIIVSIVLKKKKNIWLPGKMWKGLRRHLNLQSLVRVPVRKAPPPPTTKRQRFNDLNAAWNDPPVANVPHASAIPGTYCPPMSSPSGSSSNTSTSEMLGKIAQLTHENKRPDNPPPVPPHKMLSGRDEKPPLPMKPPVVKSVGPNSSDSVAKVSVRELAAKFSSAANV
ncbi:hypothetical protein QR680_001735 [Steinernema hermaphroditum]|uniref:EGF-like domain-containing protein n=1 Tax=Steinernema hermaphroditum TaxID=289476 RepID=A0AA39LGP2_9BILA|nr:hypothetical protein QR680_001735 [Steinernema hermaphroditum]